MNAADTAAALAARAEAVCRRYLPYGNRSGRYWCAGDVHGAAGRSLFVRLEPPGTPGKWTDAATSQNGDLLDLIRLATGARSLAEALTEARRFLAQSHTPNRAHPEPYNRTAAARNVWNRCRSIEGSHAQAYLKARRIDRCRFPALRSHPSLPYRTGAGRWSRFPALVAAVTGEDGELHGIQRTWLNPVHPVQAPVSRPRKALGRIHGLAVRFGATHPDSTLLVGEGIETVLSLVTVLPDAPLQGADLPGTVAAAALSAGSLGAFVPPKHVTRLLIAQDRDEAGERASRRLQLRCTRLGIASAVLLPAGSDFNDHLMNHGPVHLAQRLAPWVPEQPPGNRRSLAERSRMD